MDQQQSVYSPDGNWEWDGQQWLPRQQASIPPPRKPRPSLKKALIITGSVLGALIALGIVGSLASPSTPSTPTAQTSPEPTVTIAPPGTTAPVVVATPHATPPTDPPMPSAPPAPTPDTSLTMAKFNQIQNGMSYDQVKGIMGSPGDLMVDSNVAGITGQIYEWKGSGLFPAIITVQFQNGAVVMKSQAGL